MDVQKIPKRPPFTFFGAMRLTGTSKKFRKKITKKVVFVFLSLRYGADLGRSRLVKFIIDFMELIILSVQRQMKSFLRSEKAK